MKALSLSGRIIFALPFVLFGLGHLVNGSNMAAAVPSFVPGGVFWVYVTGVAMIAAGGSIISGKLIKLSSILLAVLLFTFAFTVFAPQMAKGDQMAFVGFMKDISLAGAALFIAGISGSTNTASSINK
jgi:uncharacterized membrane protein YphA (DoxX/SURF4 family)